MSRPAVFLDRDGTIIEERSYIDRLGLLSVFPWTGDALRLLNRAGYAAVVISNQSGIARGMFDEPFLMRPPLDLAKRKGGRPLAVLVESADCDACDEMHREAFGRRDVLRALERFDVARIVLGSSAPLTSPSGNATTAGAFARELGVAYTPAVVFFDASGREVFRIGAYLRPFHFASSFAYVADGAYRDEPSFQRCSSQWRSRGCARPPALRETRR